MPLPYQLTLVVHLAAMATWFGSSLTQPRRMRTALDTDLGAAKRVSKAVERETRLIVGAAVLTLLSGLALAWQIGFEHLQTRFWFGLGITVAMQTIGGAGLGRTFTQIGELVDADKLADARALSRRLAPFAGIVQALWLTNVVLMTWR